MYSQPDGVVQCDCCGCGILEIKCPYCIRESTPDEAPNLDNGKLPENITRFRHNYLFVQQIMLTVVATFSDVSPSLSCECIFPNENFIEHVKTAKIFFKICFLPELFATYSRKVFMPDQTAAASVIAIC